ncbi:MAG TPA: hypothetical protein VK348_03575 [Planctomycetota bacterium]|nr:hypothetical protein [Planctomycetota bacterium]
MAISSRILWLVLLLAVGGGLSATTVVRQEPRPQVQGDGEFERWGAGLLRSGPEAAEARTAAIDNLLGCTEPRAQAMLQERLRAEDDRDGVRSEILSALARHLRNEADKVFGGGDDNAGPRAAAVLGWTPVLCNFWRDEAAADSGPGKLRELARTCITRLPAKELEAALRARMAATGDAGERLAMLRAAADAQNLFFVPFLADFLAAGDPAVGAGARSALATLTFVAGGFASRADALAWWQRNGNRRYVDLAEAAARQAPAGVARLHEQLEERLRNAFGDLVAAQVAERQAVDWTRVQQLVLADDPPGTSVACLKRLVELLADGVPGPDQPLQRLQFHRALLAELRAAARAEFERRALLLEVAASLLRGSDADAGKEMEQMLLQQLGEGPPLLTAAALRALGRFPSPTTRAAIVRCAHAALSTSDPEARPLLAAALRALGRRGEPPCRAPLPTDADRAAWIDLLKAVFARDDLPQLRRDALALAVLPDADGERVLEAFDLLAAIAGDPAHGSELRTSYLIQLKNFTPKPGPADAFVSLLLRLLGDGEREIRLFAAEALTRLPDLGDAPRRAWLQRILETLHVRLRSETDASVLQSLLACLIATASPPGTVDKTITPLLTVIEEIGRPVPAADQFRTEPLLQALATLAAVPTATPGLWLNAGKHLLYYEKRRSLRLVLESQQAVRLAKDVKSSDGTLADCARRAMHLLLDTAGLKPQKESWAELRDEANEVSSAFLALEEAGEVIDEPKLWLLRLAALNGLGQSQAGFYQKAANFAAKLMTDNGQLSWAPAEKDSSRLLAAEAELGLGHLDQAGQLLSGCDPPRLAADAALLLQERLGKSLLDGSDSDVRKALSWLEQVLQKTAADDPRFRARLLLTARARVKADPKQRSQVLSLLDEKAALFDAPECPADVHEQFARLRGQLQQ